QSLLDMLATKEGYNRLISTYFSRHADLFAKSCPYAEVKELVNKALIMAQPTYNVTSVHYNFDLASTVWSRLLPTSRSKGRNVLLPIVYTDRDRTPSEVEALGTQEVAVLIHTYGGLYYTIRQEDGTCTPWNSLIHLPS